MSEVITVYLVYDWCGNLLGPYLSKKLAEKVYDGVKSSHWESRLVEITCDPVKEQELLDCVHGPSAMISGGRILKQGGRDD